MGRFHKELGLCWAVKGEPRLPVGDKGSGGASEWEGQKVWSRALTHRAQELGVWCQGGCVAAWAYL